MAISLGGQVNGLYYPVMDVDGDYTREEMEDYGKHLQFKFFLHTAHIYRTRQGYQFRFYYDHRFTIWGIRRLIAAAASQGYVDEKYARIVQQSVPGGRVAGKWTGKDIVLSAIVVGKGVTDTEQRVGDSLVRLFDAMANIQLPEKFLLRG